MTMKRMDRDEGQEQAASARVALDDRVPFLLSRTSYLIKKHILSTLADRGLEGMTGEEMAILARLHETPGLSQSEISNRTIKDKTTVSRLIAGMERKNLIERRRDAADRRVFHVHLTERGEAFVTALFGLMDQVTADITAGISQEDLRTMLKTLKAVYSRAVALHASKEEAQHFS